MRKKDASFLLVDGYNIIHAWPLLKELAEESLESARDKLVDILCDYRGCTEADVIVVFDAHKVKGGSGSFSEHNNIFVVYTKEAETADHYIERTVKSISHNYNVSVATSDSLEQIIIMGGGATRISARELYNRIRGTKEKNREMFMQERKIKENLLFDNINPEASEFLEKLRHL